MKPPGREAYGFPCRKSKLRDADHALRAGFDDLRVDLDIGGRRRSGADETVGSPLARYGQVSGGRNGSGWGGADPGVGQDGRSCGCRRGADGECEPYERAEERIHGSSSIALDSHPTVSRPEAPDRELFARLERIAP